MADVYITRISKFLPNESVSNDEMEEYLGLINGKGSKSKNIILDKNGIKERYYALNKSGQSTHTNAEMTALAVKNLFIDTPEEIEGIDLLCCGTSTPDQMIPSHALMVHGLLPMLKDIEVISPAGVCCSGMHAFKYAYMALKTEEKSMAVSTGSERTSGLIRAKQFEEEVKKLKRMEQNPYLAFEKDFLRWMLSDGAGAFLMKNTKNPYGISLRVDWIEMCSFANIKESCMYMAAEKTADGSLKSFMDYPQNELITRSVFSIKQDIKLLCENIVELGFKKLKSVLETMNQNIDEIDYLLPHLSSYFFENIIEDTLKSNGINIPKDKWYTNLNKIGNIGAGSIYLILEELLNNGTLRSGEKILMVVPESARFSYVFSLLTVF